MYNEDYDKEILWRKEFSVLTGIIFVVGFIICAVIGFFSWKEYLYEYQYQPNLFESANPFGLAIPTGLLGGYIFLSLLSGLLFTIHFLSKRSTATKVVMTVLFIIPILLIVLGIVYSIPYAIYNIIKLIILKSKKRNVTRIKPKYPKRYANATGVPTPQPLHIPYINNTPTPPMKSENSLVNQNQPPHMNINANAINEENHIEEADKTPEEQNSNDFKLSEDDCNSAQKNFIKMIDDCLSEMEDLLIYEKPYDKPGIKRTEKKEKDLEDNINNKSVKENPIQKENEIPDTSTDKQQEKVKSPTPTQAPIENPIETPSKPFIQNSTPFRITNRLPKDPENPYGDDFSSMV